MVGNLISGWVALRDGESRVQAAGLGIRANKNRLLVAPLFLAIPGAAVAFLVGYSVHSYGPVMRLVMISGAVTGAYAVLLRLLYPTLIPELIARLQLRARRESK